MIMGKEKFIPIIALMILLIGTGSSAYVYATQVDTDTIMINGQEYTIDQIFFIAEPRVFDSLNYSGVALDDLVMKAGVGCPSCHRYTIIAGDTYARTVTWENMKNGLLTKDRLVVFPDLGESFWVKNVVTIEVI